MRAFIRPLLYTFTLVLLVTDVASAQTVLFGSKTYTRTAGPPNQFSDTFTPPAGTTAPYTLHIVNGNANGTNRISSATVKLNGVQILGPSDFSQNIAVLDRTVTLQANNTLEIRLTSAPGSFITVSMLDTNVGTQPTALTPNPLNLTTGATGTLTVTLAPASTTTGALTVTSANPAVAIAPASVSFTAGQTSVAVPVTGVSSGSTTVTVSFNGGSAASQVDVALPIPTVTGFTPTSGQPGTSVTLTGTNFVNVQTVRFNGVLATFTVLTATTLTAVVPPTATTGAITVTTLAGTGTSAASFTVIPAPTIASLQPATLPVVQGSTGTLTVTLSAVETSATTVALTSSDTSVATVPGTVTVPAYQLSDSVPVTAVTQGTADITASLNGTSATSTIAVVNPVPSITTLAPTSLPSGSPITTLTITGQPFVSGAIVTFGTTALATTFVSATQLTATIPAALLTTKGTVPIRVHNPAPGGGPSNSLPFTIVNGAPVLAPIGNQIVPLGSTLSFTATATDPDNDPVQFSATPLPLMAHATFTTQTGQFVFTPDATQVGTFPLTVTASDGIATVSETITITVTGAPPGGTTNLTGRVVDGSGQPIANMVVAVKATGQAGTTNSQGQFTINGITVIGRQVLLANGMPLGYAILAAPVDLIPNVQNNLASDLRVPVVDTAHAVTVNPAATTVISNPTLPNTTVTIAPNTAKNADGTNFTGALSISPVPEYGRPESRPVELKPGFSITIQPAGITLSTPAPITLPNTDNLPPGNELDLWSLSPDTGTFYIAGRMRVSADGTKLETISGGVRKTAWHFALAFAAQFQNYLNHVLGGCTECEVNSKGDLTEGTLTQTILVPGVRTLGVSRDLTLQYNSTTADVQPILPIDATLDVRAAVPQTFSADLTVGGLKQGTRGYWNAAVMNEDATSSTRMSVSYNGATLPTGRYPYELVTYSNYAQSSIGAVTNGYTVIRNEQASPFGAGWGVKGLDRLVLTADDTILLATGEGRTVPFVSAALTALVSWWPAEGTGVDIRGGNNGVPTNGATYAGGQLGSGFVLDGVDDYVRVAHSATLDPTGSFTIAAWIKTTPQPNLEEQIIASKWECGGACPASATALYRFGLAGGSPGILFGGVRRSQAAPGNNGQFFVGNRVVADGQWHHVAFTRDVTAQELRLSVDGQLDASLPLTADGDGPLVDGDGEADPLTIGAIVRGGLQSVASFFKGTLDEVEFSTRAVPQLELTALYTAGGRRDVTTTFLPPPSEYSSIKKNPDGTYTRTLKDGTTYQFNAQGYQTALADRNGNTTTYLYNGSNQLATITDPVGQVTTLAYNGARLATITDPAGRVTSVTYDDAGNLITVEAPDQTRTSFNYDAQHRMVQKRDARGQVYVYQFDSAGRLKQATLPTGENREIRPTEMTSVPDLANGVGVPGNPATIQQPPVIQATFKDAKGQTTTFETDTIGRVTMQKDPLNRITRIDRDTQGNPTKITRPNGAITTMTYDVKGNLLTSTEQSITATTTFTYEPTFNQVTSITDPKGNQTTITYDAKGNPLTITDADNNVTRFFYDARGLLTETRDALYPANPATIFTYDPLGRLLTTTDPLHRTTTLTYDSAGNVATSKDHLDRITAFEYDVKNRLKKVTDPLLGETVYTYDGNGNLLTVKDAKNQITTFAYDSRNRLASTTDPLGKVETYEYDGNDNLTKRITPKLDQIVFAYDPVNQLLSKTLPGNLLTSYQYDLVGNLTTVTDPDSVLTMTYDQANRLLTTSTTGSSNQPTVTLSADYDKTGNRLALTHPTGQTSYAYDVLNRLSRVAASDANTCPASPTADLVSWWRAEGTATDSQDGNTGTLQNGLTFATGRVGQAFSLDGLNDHVAIPFATNLNLAPTGAFTLAAWVQPQPRGQFQAVVVKSPTSGIWDWGLYVDPTGHVVSGRNGNLTVSSSTVVQAGQWIHAAVTYSNGTWQLYMNGVLESTATGALITQSTGGLALGRTGDANSGYSQGLIDEVRLYSRVLTPGELAAGACQDATTFTYDALSRRTAMTLPNGTQTTYTYDPASQVTAILHQLGASGPTINQAAYTYNGVGNRESLTDRRGVQNFGYDTLDRLTSASHPLLGTAQAFAYDAVGNRTTVGTVTNAGNQLTADATHAYQYDDNGNLTRKTLLATGNYSQYSYDAENRLTRVEDFAAGNPTPAFTSTYRYDGLGRRIEKVANGQTKRYIYDGEDILLEYDGSNVLQARYTHGPGIDEPIAVTKGGSTFFYHQDGLGSVTDLTDATGATAKSYSYDAYGNILESPGTLEQPYTYTGRELDAESSLYYYRARYYDSSTGRFLQKDPIGMEGGLNLYRYVENNPANWIDSIGLAPKDKTYGLPSDFWKWYHRQEKRPGDPDINQDQARDLYDEWKRKGKPDPDGHRTEPENDTANGNANYCPTPDPMPPLNIIPAPDDQLPDYVRPFLPKDPAAPKAPRIPGRVPTIPFRFPIPAW